MIFLGCYLFFYAVHVEACDKEKIVDFSCYFWYNQISEKDKNAFCIFLIEISYVDDFLERPKISPDRWNF